MIRVQVEKGKTKCRTDLPEDIARPISPAVVEKTSVGRESLLFDPDFFHSLKAETSIFIVYTKRG